MPTQVIQVPFKKNNPFNISVDFDSLIAYAQRLTQYKMDKETHYCGLHDTDHRVTQEEWDADTAKFLQEVIDLKEHPEKIEPLVKNMRKKKDGSFYKGCVSVYASCPCTGWYYEEGYGIKYDTVRIKADGDTSATIYIHEDIQSF